MVVADEPVADEFSVPASEVERYAYGWSVVSCLPSAMDDPETAATGAVMRPATLARYAHAAGFARTETLPLESDVWRFYRLVPRGPESASSTGRASASQVSRGRPARRS